MEGEGERENSVHRLGQGDLLFVFIGQPTLQFKAYISQTVLEHYRPLPSIVIERERQTGRERLTHKNTNTI